MTPDLLILRNVLDICRVHHQALAEALADLPPITIATFDNLTKEQRRIFDQFAYRYTRFQDDMGARLFPAILYALGEDIKKMAMLDILERLDQIGWLPSANEWNTLRHIRNEFSHDYPQSATERCNRLQLAYNAAQRISVIFTELQHKINRRFFPL